jgi:hypothetical protein
MAYEAVIGSQEPATESSAGFASEKVVIAGVGAVVGGLSTLGGTLGFAQLLQDNPFLGLALFSLLLASLIFVFALAKSTTRVGPAATFALVLLCVGIVAGGVAVLKGPLAVNLNVRATPLITEAKPIRFGDYDIVWGSSTTKAHIPASGNLTLDLTGVQSYYDDRQKKNDRDNYEKCFALLEKYSKLNLGPGTPTPLSGG